MNIIKKCSFLIVFILLTACGSSTPGLDELRELCEKDAGLTINKTVEANGYYDDTTKCQYCWHDLINSPFDQVEFCDYESARHPLTYILKEHGCYRLSKVKRDSGQCHAEINKDIEKRVIEPFASFKEEQCINVESIDKPDMGLGLFLNKNEEVVVGNNFGVSRYEYTIKSFDDNQKYGQYINYSLVVKTVGGAQHVCNSPLLTGERVFVKNPSLYKTFIGKIIKVIK